MSLSVGIVGLPNVGKSTLFNALLKKQQAFVASYPFATIEPNVGIVPVPDPRPEKIAKIVKESEGMKDLPPTVPATVEFVDIAGLVRGAHKGEGLGNQFLAHIREATIICHVLRLFEDPNVVKEGSTDPKGDLETVETELKLADLATLEKQKEVKGSTDKVERSRWSAVTKLREALQKGKPAREAELTKEEEDAAHELSLLTAKPILVVLNIAENELNHAAEIEKKFAAELDIPDDQVTTISAKIEAELADLSEEEGENYLSAYAVEEPGLGRLIKKAYATLGLITFFSARPNEVRAWTVREGMNVKEAGGTIHSDFEERFIKADVIPFEEFSAAGGWKTAREKGKVRTEGKDYIVTDGDVIEFKVGA